MLVYITNIINDKLDNSYIELYKIINIKDIIVYLILLEIKVYLKFYISLFRKVLLDILLYNT